MPDNDGQTLGYVWQLAIERERTDITRLLLDEIREAEAGEGWALSLRRVLDRIVAGDHRHIIPQQDV